MPGGRSFKALFFGFALRPTKTGGLRRMLKFEPIQMTGAVQYPLDHHEARFAFRVENQVAAMNGDAHAAAVLLSQAVKFGVVGDLPAMDAQFGRERQRAGRIVGGDV